MTAALEGGEWSAARSGRTLPPGKDRYPFYRKLGGPQGRSGRAENLVPTGIRYRTVQPVVSRYTDWATRPTRLPFSNTKLSSEIILLSAYSSHGHVKLIALTACVHPGRRSTSVAVRGSIKGTFCITQTLNEGMGFYGWRWKGFFFFMGRGSCDEAWARDGLVLHMEISCFQFLNWNQSTSAKFQQELYIQDTCFSQAQQFITRNYAHGNMFRLHWVIIRPSKELIQFLSYIRMHFRIQKAYNE